MKNVGALTVSALNHYSTFRTSFIQTKEPHIDAEEGTYTREKPAASEQTYAYIYVMKTARTVLRHIHCVDKYINENLVEPNR